MLRTLHIGLGPLGRLIATDLVHRRLGHIAGAVDPRHAGELLGGVTVADSLDDLPPADVAFVATSSKVHECLPALRTLLRAGLTVVSTCEELAYPWVRHRDAARELDELGRAHGGRLLGTGVNPGFLMDAFPLAVTTACRAVRAIRIERVQDASVRRLPFQKKIGVGLDAAAFELAATAGTLRHVGLTESIDMLAAGLGFAVDIVEETLGPVLDEAGLARGVRQVGRGFAGDRPVIELHFVAALGEPDPRDRVTVDGEPPVDVIWRGGLHGDVATSAIVLNSVRSLMAAPPGLHTMLSLPLGGCATRVTDRQ